MGGISKGRRLNLVRAISLLWKASPGWFVLSGVLLVLQAGLPLVQLYLMKIMVESVTAAIGAPDARSAFGRVGMLIGLMCLAALTAVLLSSVARVVGQAQGQAVTDHVQEVIHDKSVSLDLEYYENAGFYDTLHRAQSGSAQPPDPYRQRAHPGRSEPHHPDRHRRPAGFLSLGHRGGAVRFAGSRDFFCASGTRTGCTNGRWTPPPWTGRPPI